MNLFELFAKLSLDTSDYEKGLKDSETKTKSFGGKVGTALKVVGGGAAAFAAAGAAIYGMSKKTADATDHIDKMSQKLGISREAYQELDFVMSQSGTSVDNLRGGLKTLTKAMTTAEDGNKTTAEAFEKLGISVTDSSGKMRSQEDVFFDVISALQNVDNQTEKAALANQLLGRSGTELMPLLNGAAGSMDEMRQQAHDLGLVLGDETIDAGVHLTDTIDQVTRSFDAIVVKVGGEVMPIVQTALDWVLAHMPEIQAVVSTAFGVIAGAVQTVINIVSEYVIPAFDAVVQFVQGVFTGNWQDAWDNVKATFYNIWVGISTWFLERFTEARDAILSVDWLALGSQILDWIIEAFAGLVDWAYNTFTAATEIIKTVDWAGVGSYAWDMISNAFKFIGSWFFTTFNEVPGKVKEVKWLELGKAILNLVKTAIMGVAAMFKQFFQDAWDEVKKIDWKDLGEKIWNWIIDKVKDFASWARAIFDFGVAQIKQIDWAQLGTDIWNWIIDKIKGFGGWAKSVFEFAVGQIKEVDWLQLGKDIIGGIFDGLGDIAGAIGDFFESAWDAVQDIDWLGLGSDIFDGIIGGIGDLVGWFEGAFDFSGIKIKWPHLSVTDWVDIPVVGRIPWGFRVDWYKKAMDTPYMFTKPTLFGAGEAGDEMMYGKANLMHDIRDAVSSVQKPSDNITINVYAQPGDDLDELARKVEQSLIRFEEQRKAAYA